MSAPVLRIEVIHKGGDKAEYDVEHLVIYTYGTSPTIAGEASTLIIEPQPDPEENPHE